MKPLRNLFLNTISSILTSATTEPDVDDLHSLTDQFADDFHSMIDQIASSSRKNEAPTSSSSPSRQESPKNKSTIRVGAENLTSTKTTSTNVDRGTIHESEAPEPATAHNKSLNKKDCINLPTSPSHDQMSHQRSREKNKFMSSVTNKLFSVFTRSRRKSSLIVKPATTTPHKTPADVDPSNESICETESEGDDGSLSNSSLDDLGLLENTPDNREKIQYPNGNVTYRVEGMKHQIAWATIQTGHNRTRKGKRKNSFKRCMGNMECPVPDCQYRSRPRLPKSRKHYHILILAQVKTHTASITTSS